MFGGEMDGVFVRHTTCVVNFQNPSRIGTATSQKKVYHRHRIERYKQRTFTKQKS